MNTVASKTMPDSYDSGIKYVNDLAKPTSEPREMRRWLIAELFEDPQGCHKLAGGHDDYPVQAIVNHYPYFSEEAKTSIRHRLTEILKTWPLEYHSRWTESAGRALLSLISELPVPEALPHLRTQVRHVNFDRIEQVINPALMRTYAQVMSITRDPVDIEFWQKVPTLHPRFSTMAEQILLKIATN